MTYEYGRHISGRARQWVHGKTGFARQKYVSIEAVIRFTGKNCVLVYGDAGSDTRRPYSYFLCFLFYLHIQTVWLAVEALTKCISLNNNDITS